MSARKTGKDTSEYAVVIANTRMGLAAFLVGIVVAIASTFTEAGGTTEIIAGAAIAIAGVIQATLVRLGYIKSRTAVKTGRPRFLNLPMFSREIPPAGFKRVNTSKGKRK